jgi:hypothetical protein
MQLASISPASVAAGSPDLTVTLTGSGFTGLTGSTRSGPGGVGSSQVVWLANKSTTGLATTFVDSTRLTAVVPAALLRETVNAQVYVLIPKRMGDGMKVVTVAQSNAVPFTVTPPPPPPAQGLAVISSISPTSVAAGSPDLTVTLRGSGFVGVGRSLAVWRTKDSTTGLVTTIVNAGELTAVVPAALLRDTVHAQVYVQIFARVMDETMRVVMVAQSNAVPFTVRRP